MPGLSLDATDRTERIISLINDGLKGNVSSLSAFDMSQDRSCWRCERLVATNRWTLCDECRAYLSCETDKDPNDHKPNEPQPMPFWGGWWNRPPRAS